jgi:hypothetical protein
MIPTIIVAIIRRIHAFFIDILGSSWCDESSEELKISEWVLNWKKRDSPYIAKRAKEA